MRRLAGHSLVGSRSECEAEGHDIVLTQVFCQISIDSNSCCKYKKSLPNYYSFCFYFQLKNVIVLKFFVILQSFFEIV